jgi:hypothetical protein
MREKQELLGGQAAVKGTMVQAHLAWATARMPDAARKVEARVPAEVKSLVNGDLLATEWVPFRSVIQIDRAIAEVVGGVPEVVYRDLGHHSAAINLGGVYKSFVVGEPHRFFDRAARLHDRFQNFGKATYEQTGERAGRITLTDYTEYSPVYCASGLGYYEGALQLMKVPGPIKVSERTCVCAGDASCQFEFSW